MSIKGSLKNSLMYAVISDETAGCFKKLYGNKYANERLIEYYSKKLKLSLAVLIIGIVGFLIYPYIKTPVLTEPYAVYRNSYGKGSRTVSVDYAVSGGEKKSMDITVNEKKYTASELETMFSSFENALEKKLLGSNESPDHVTDDLSLVSSLKDYPFTVSYKTDNPAVISYSGRIDHSKTDGTDGELVTVIATVTYDDFRKEIYVPVFVFDREKTAEQAFDLSFENEIKKADEATESLDYMSLPKSVDGYQVYYFEKGEYFRFLIPVLAFVFAAVLFIGNNDGIKKEIKKRDEQLISDYPVLINKFAIFYNAGMPVNTIWNRLCAEYEDSKNKTGELRYVYEEMLITKTMILDGKNEIEAYEDFAKRCGLRQYKVFVSLLQQAITKGKGNMGELLKCEAEDAFTSRKNDAKRLSEEASSKLLLPMFMMLAVVMIMIMFPAFKSFN